MAPRKAGVRGPGSEYSLDLSKLHQSAGYCSPADFVFERLYSTSPDGTRVPLFVVRRRDLTAAGNHPTILTGYGGFGVGQQPKFNATMLPWLEAGGVYVIAGLRGGDEYGEAWHRAGMLDKKQQVFDDFIGAAEHLIRIGYTSPAKLGITGGSNGGSNGGLLTGAVLTRRPELFGAVSINVPLLDMIRYPKFLMARYWIPEYGDPAKAADFFWLRAYWPYHHIRAGVAYPSVLLRAGANDGRTHPLHARKMAAVLQASSASDEGTRPTLLYVDPTTGHGPGRSIAASLESSADMQAYFGCQLGLSFKGESAPSSDRVNRRALTIPAAPVSASN